MYTVFVGNLFYRWAMRPPVKDPICCLLESFKNL